MNCTRAVAASADSGESLVQQSARGRWQLLAGVFDDAPYPHASGWSSLRTVARWAAFAAPNTSDAEPAEDLKARSLGPTVDNIESSLETADSGKLLVWSYNHSLENSLRSAWVFSCTSHRRLVLGNEPTVQAYLPLPPHGDSLGALRLFGLRRAFSSMHVAKRAVH